MQLYYLPWLCHHWLFIYAVIIPKKLEVWIFLFKKAVSIGHLDNLKIELYWNLVLKIRNATFYISVSYIRRRTARLDEGFSDMVQIWMKM